MRICTAVMLASLAFSAACGDAATPTPRLVEMRKSWGVGTPDGLARMVLEYADAGHLDTIIGYDANGQLYRTYSFIYEGDLITDIAEVDASGYGGIQYAVSYDGDDRPTRVDITLTTGFDTQTLTVEADYDGNGQLVLVTETLTAPDATDQLVTEYDYDSDRLSRIELVGLDDYADFAYGGDGVSEITESSMGATYVTDFSYSHGELVRVTGQGDDRYDLEYDGDNIATVTNYWQEQTHTTVEYTYEHGEMRGLVPVPEFPYGGMFHMRGRIMRPQQLLTTEMLDL